MRDFFSELRKRKVIGAAVAYAVIAWGVIEVAGTVLQMAEAPAWIARVVLIVVALGFPVVIVLSWLFDLPTGPKMRRLQVGIIIVVLIVGAGFGTLALLHRPATPKALAFTQLTDFADAASAPAVSPDGKMVAFLKGEALFGNSAAASELYLKQLPNGDAVQLTNMNVMKATPTFTPDGQHVTFTRGDPKFRWATYVVSTNGGPATELMPNASGLTWLDSTHVMFAETHGPGHMGIRRATTTRADIHDVYFPPRETDMAHRAALSPDRKSVLIVEMDAGAWLPCRVVPADGSSAGRKVGPLDGGCTYAAWSPDGRWMYFSSSSGGAFHVWRQRFPNGQPERLTQGPTEEEGLAVAPDGKSLITSAGVRQNAIWLMDAPEDRQISVEDFASQPKAMRDGRRILFLNRVEGKREYFAGKLLQLTLENNVRQELLPGYTMVHFDLSMDDSLVAFATGFDDAEKQGIWVAPLDRSGPPHRVFAGVTDRVFFDAAQNIYFAEIEGTTRFLHRLRAPDYKVNERVYEQLVRFLFAASPDGEWMLAMVAGSKGEGLQQVAISTRGLPARTICSFCAGGTGPTRQLAPPLAWTRDGRTLLVSVQYVGQEYFNGPGFTVAIPVKPGAPFPAIPATGIRSAEDYTQQPGARIIQKKNMLPGASAQQLFYYQPTTIRNLYRLQLPD